MPVINRSDAVSAICEQLEEGRCILFLGSGVSATYTDPSGKAFHGLPTGKDLLSALADTRTYVSPNMSLMQALTMKFLHEKRRGLIDFISEHIPATPGVVPPAYIEIAKLPLSAVITTNWDLHLETALQQARINHHVIVQDSDIPIFRPASIPVIKFHGTINRPDSIVATFNDILDLFARRPVLSSLLRALCAQGTILFLGYALDDPDFWDLYRGLQRELVDYMPVSFAVQLASSPQSVTFWSHQGISIIESDLTDFLQLVNTRLFLNSATALRRLGRSEEWTSDPLLRGLIGAGSLPTEGRVVDGLLRHLLRMLDTGATLEYIAATLSNALKTLITYRPTYQVLRDLTDRVFPLWFPPHTLGKEQAKEKVNALLAQREGIKTQIAMHAATIIAPGDKLLVYSQSTRVIDALKWFLREHPNESNLQLIVCERRHKSPNPVHDGLCLAEELDGYDIPVRIIPDASVAYLMSTGQVTKVLLGAHSVAALPDGTITFTNTTGTLMIVRLADAYNIPIYVVAEEAKISTAPLDIGGIAAGAVAFVETNPLQRELMKAHSISYFNPGWDPVSTRDAAFTLITERGVRGFKSTGDLCG